LHLRRHANGVVFSLDNCEIANSTVLLRRNSVSITRS